MPTERENLLCVVNYRANIGYAWDFIESLYARVADRLAARDITTYVAYPRISSPPRSLTGSAAIPVQLDATLSSVQSLRNTIAFIRQNSIRSLYLTDLSSWSVSYAAARAAGIRFLLLHDHTSGERIAPTGLRRTLKRMAVSLPGVLPDVTVTVSDYVARRQREVGLVPEHRVIRIWNGIALPNPAEGAARALRLSLGIGDRPMVACACRASPVKGVNHLLAAFDLAVRNVKEGSRPVLVYVGDGPHLEALTEIRNKLAARDDIHLLGYRADAAAIVQAADVCVVPSVWQDALPLSVLEPMAAARAVIATTVGGIPEMIVDGESGLLVPPRDEAALGVAIGRLLADSQERNRLGRAARERVERHFSPHTQIDGLTSLFERGLGIDRPQNTNHPVNPEPDRPAASIGGAVGDAMKFLGSSS